MIEKVSLMICGEIHVHHISAIIKLKKEKDVPHPSVLEEVEGVEGVSKREKVFHNVFHVQVYNEVKKDLHPLVVEGVERVKKSILRTIVLWQMQQGERQRNHNYTCILLTSSSFPGIICGHGGIRC